MMEVFLTLFKLAINSEIMWKHEDGGENAELGSTIVMFVLLLWMFVKEAAYVLGCSWHGWCGWVAPCGLPATGTATLQLTMGSRSCSVSRPEFLQLAPSYTSVHGSE